MNVLYFTADDVFCAQLEESEFTCAAAVKARKAMEVEMDDLHVQMEDTSKAKQAVRVVIFLSVVTGTEAHGQNKEVHRDSN